MESFFDIAGIDLYKAVVIAFIASILIWTVSRFYQVHSFKRVNIGDGGFRVVYSTDKVRIGMNLGILRVRDGEFILYDKDRVESLHQPVSDVKAEPSYLKPYPVKITSLFHGLKPKQGWQSMRAFEAALNEQGGQFGSDTPGSKA